ncbi:MAG: ABC transporter substrate-binding protein [Alphaproteobacteria bacterium]|nr:ABC transporter substrate-binding protein [Alphaproteobacteria bacterium]
MTRLKLLQNQLKAALICFTFFCSSAFADAPMSTHKTIGITQIVDHPSLNAIREGILDGLAKEGFVQGKDLTVIFETAQGNPTTATQIAQHFAGLSLDAVVPITTPSAQAIVQKIKETPIIFAAISDPLNAKVVTSLDHPGGNVTGVADIPPIEEQLEFIENCIPNLKTLGVVYNPGEVNNVSFLEKLTSVAKKKNIKVVTAAASKSADVQAAANSLVEKVDAIFIGNDNTVVSGLEALVKTCLNAHKPLFVSDPESVDRGALAAYAYDQREIGRQVGKMVAQVLKGKNPGDMPVQRAEGLKLSLNPHTAEQLKITCALAAHPNKDE